jgi:class 3 adenylate cyclase
MTCAACGVANDPGRKFCRECGARMSLACAACGAPNGPEDKFCGDCGEPLVATGGGSVGPSATTHPGRESETERRLVSVLFVDLVGFTTFSENRDAEDVRAMLTRYFDAASDAVQRHGGTVEKFIGDAVMAVWGTPVAHEDDAERAVRSALEIVDRVAAIGTMLGLDLQARAGVLTGVAVAVRDAVDQGFVTGDLVNTASRLQSAAEPGTVLVGEKTYNAIASSIACTPVASLSLKGKAGEVAAWRALRVLSEMGGSGRGTAPEPPFGGRDEELRLSKELLHATGREGRPRLLHVSGVAGIGKSRLVWELQKYVDGLTETFFWHQGRCPSYGDGVSFWALAEMVRGRARIADTDDDATSQSALRACLEEYVPDEDERRWIEPRLAHLLGLGGVSGDRDEMFGAWRRFFERVAEHGTAVLVFEDLHSADPGLLDFIESMLEWSRTSPLMVLSLARPELSDRRPTWGSGLRSSTTVHLDRLADSDVEAMVTGYVDGLPADGLARLVSRAEGVPMYAVETVRMLASRGVLEQTGESYVVVGELGGELEIPETLHALVAARLDNLPEAERALVQDASVAGHSFTLAAASAVSGHDRASIEPLLRTLVRKEVLDQDVDPRSPERGQYRFVQSVIQEVAYSTLSKSARRTRHLACARWLESLQEEELSGIVASHYLDAYRAEPGAGDAEEVADHAREWLVRACDRAASLGSPEQAFGYSIAALGLATSAATRASLSDRAARSAFYSGDEEATISYLREACRDYQALGDPMSEALLLCRVASIDANRDEVTARIRDVETRLPESNGSERVLVLSTLANGRSHAHQLPEALELSERALVLAQSLEVGDDDNALREAVAARAFAVHMAGRHLESRLLEEASLAMARRSGNPLAQARALMHMGVTIAEDDPRASLTAMLECASIAARIGVRPMQLLALANAAEAGVDLGEWEVSDDTLREAALISTGVLVEEEGLTLTRAMLTAHRDDPVRALDQLAALEDRRGDTWDVVMMRTWFLRVRSMCLALGGDAHAAVRDAAASVELDPSGGNAPTSLWMAVQAGAALSDVTSVRSALGHTMGLRGGWVRLVRATGQGVIAALDGDADGNATMRGALDAWREAGLPLDHALATLCALHVAPGLPGLDSDVTTARTYLLGLRATSLLRLFDEVAPT